MKILIGTTNKAKQEEYKNLLGDLKIVPINDVKIIFPQDLDIAIEPDETGSTFAENSLLKAKFYYEKSVVPTIADDGGLEIPILNNEPGILSRRWLGRESTDEELIEHTLERLKKFKTDKERMAYLTVCITYFDGKTILQEFGKVEGYIARRGIKKYSKGYPFRALFIVSGLNKYYDELTLEEHAKYNHRKKALERLWRQIESDV